MHTMKRISVLLMILIVASCGNKSNNNEDIKKQIADYKKQVTELNNKITELENQLDSDTTQEVYKVPVYVQTLKSEPFNHYIEVNGTVEAKKTAFISPEISGQIIKVFVSEGDRVTSGQLLVKLNASVTESAIKEVETGLELATIVYERQKQLWDKKIGSELDYLSAKNNKESLESKLKTLQAQYDMAVIKAPIDGTVDDIYMKVGEMVMPGMQIMNVVNLDDLYINADVSEAYITKIKKGDQVLLSFPSYPDLDMEVPVYRIGNVVKEANRTFNVQLRIKNRNEMIKPNVMAIIKINDYAEQSALILPSIVVKQDIKGSYIYTANQYNNNTVARKKYIETGLSYGEWSMITSGLQEGEKVIISGYNQVSDGTVLEIRKKQV